MFELNESKLRSMTIRNEAVEDLSDGIMKMITGTEPKTVTKTVDGKEATHEVKPEWIVKNMSADELQKAVDDASMSLALLKENLPKEKSGNPIVDSLMLLIKTCNDQQKKLSHETLYRINILKYGSVSPIVSHTNAVLVATHFGLDFKKITDKILLLSQMGSSFPMGE